MYSLEDDRLGGLEDPDYLMFEHLTREAVVLLEVQIENAKRLAREANALTQSIMDRWIAEPQNKELYSNFKQADRISDGLTALVIDLKDTQDHLKSPSKELFNQWIKTKSLVKYKDSSNPQSRRQQQVKLLLSLAHTEMKSSDYRRFKMH